MRRYVVIIIVAIADHTAQIIPSIIWEIREERNRPKVVASRRVRRTMGGKERRAILAVKAVENYSFELRHFLNRIARPLFANPTVLETPIRH